MTTPAPRMMVLNYYGYEYFCALPETFDVSCTLRCVS